MGSQTWLITGASSGLGLELALAAAENGDTVIASSRTPEKIGHLAERGILAARLDQSEPLAQIKADVQTILDTHGRVDFVVNCAAYVQTGILEDLTPVETEEQFNTNVFGALNVYRAVLPSLRKQRSGTLITIGSMAAWFADAGASVYNASKAALRILSLGLAKEIEPLGIRHLLVEPARFRTELLAPDGNYRTSNGRDGIADYGEISQRVFAAVASESGNQPGDPGKAAKVLYKIIKGSCGLNGKPLPDFLPLGSDAVDEISKAAHNALNICQEWEQIARSTDFAQ
ncbi:3-oxoacyl-(acyl-carrier-protein) reductase [Purpureocillium lilacinum]|uniref:3-oxoacyl-(Acyl-carrier-protein) reductase n=1 Tax=Purpureocillium lilacinum TaxID=33203 RepID=A0A179G9B7_PURLI|nr:3-oxoacyl-(acyl-carrier-protein) reductase [Purpureocillium lilacinum]OAQ74402.1 3-oxoacyl-(acyl-carrier-protein) reductase [Purpureocillium lilacinum]